MNPGLPPVNPIPPLGVGTFGPPSFHPGSVPQRGIPFGGYSAFPFFGFGDTPVYPPVQNIIVVQQPAPPVIVQETPRETARAEIREYKQTTPSESGPGQEQPSFAIALRDSSVHSAMAVTVQNDTLHYVDPDGRHERVSLDAVDRETTTRLNRARKLELRLPPPTTR